MPTATADNIRHWRGRIHEIDTASELAGLIAEIGVYDLPDPEPSQDMGGLSASIRCQAAGLVAAAAARVIHAQAGRSHPGGPLVYDATRNTPTAGATLTAMGLPGEASILIPMRSFGDPYKGRGLAMPPVSPGHNQVIRATVQQFYDRIKNLVFAENDPNYAPWRENMTYCEDILLRGDLPGPWKQKTVAAITSVGAVIF